VLYFFANHQRKYLIKYTKGNEAMMRREWNKYELSSSIWLVIAEIGVIILIFYMKNNFIIHIGVLNKWRQLRGKMNDFAH